MAYKTAAKLYEKTWAGFLQEIKILPCLTLIDYCRKVHINYKGMSLWATRQGLSVSKAKENLPEGSSHFTEICPKTITIAEESGMLYGVTLRFNSGTTVTIRQGDAESIMDLVKSYERKDGELCIL